MTREEQRAMKKTFHVFGIIILLASPCLAGDEYWGNIELVTATRSATLNTITTAPAKLPLAALPTAQTASTRQKSVIRLFEAMATAAWTSAAFIFTTAAASPPLGVQVLGQVIVVIAGHRHDQKPF
jgi:hypothetical protein